MNKSQISTSLSWFTVIGDVLVFTIFSIAVGFSIHNRAIGSGIVSIVLALVSLALLMCCTIKVAFVARIDGGLVFRKFFTSEHGRIEHILAVREIPFMKYPRYSLLFIDEKGAQQSIVLIPAFNYKELNALRSALQINPE